MQRQIAFAKQCIPVWLHCCTHVVGHARESEKPAYGIRHLRRNNSIRFLHHDENRAPEFFGCHEFELARRRGESASVSHGRLLHCRAPKELPALDEESAGYAQLHRLLKRLLNSVTEALNTC